jgi:hypothetical protein
MATSVFDAAAPISCISTSPDQRWAAIGGRDGASEPFVAQRAHTRHLTPSPIPSPPTPPPTPAVLKVVDLVASAPALKESRNLRTNRRKTPDLVANDIRWHPVLPHVLATASTNGAVLVWDLHKVKTTVTLETVFRHGRTVNRLAWNPVHEPWLLSAGQDGVCRIWDARVSHPSLALAAAAGGPAEEAAAAAALFPAPVAALRSALQGVELPVQPDGTSHLACGAAAGLDTSAAVRDAQFDPFDPFVFAAGSEDGSIALWDVRRPDNPTRRFTAHAGLVNALAFHPTRRGVLVTGGRDRLVKVWALAGEGEKGADAGAGVGAGAPVSDQDRDRDRRTSEWLAEMDSTRRQDAAAAADDAGEGGHGSGQPRATGGVGIPTTPPPSVFSIAAAPISAPLPPPSAEETVVTIQTTASVARLGWRATAHPWAAWAAPTSSSSSSGAAAPPPSPPDPTEFHVASCAALLDNICYVWDVRIPHLPVALFRGHKDVATSLVWVDGHGAATEAGTAASGGGDAAAVPPAPSASTSVRRPWLLSGGKDGRILLHDPATAERPQSSLRTTGLSVSAREVATSYRPIHRLAFWDAPDAATTASVAGGPLVEPGTPFRFEVSRVQPPGGVAGGPLAVLFDLPAHVLTRLAYEYRTEGAPVEVLCSHNAGVAESAGLVDMARTWRVLGILFGPMPTAANALPRLRYIPRPRPAPRASTAATDEPALPSAFPSAPASAAGASGAKAAEVTEDVAATVVQLAAPPPVDLSPSASPTRTGLLVLDLTSDDEGGDDERSLGSASAGGPPSGLAGAAASATPSAAALVARAGPPVPGLIRGFLAALAAVHPEASRAPIWQDLDEPGTGDAGAVRGGAAGGATADGRRRRGAPAATARGSFPAAAAAAAATTNRSSSAGLARASSGLSPTETAGLSTPSSPLVSSRGLPIADSPDPLSVLRPGGLTATEAEDRDWRQLRLTVAKDVLRGLAEAGNVQGCVTVSRVLGPEVEGAVGRRLLQQWLVQYIDLLHRLRIWSPASTVMARASDEGIRRLNQLSTSVLAACGSCSKDATGAAVPDVAPRAGDGAAGGACLSHVRPAGAHPATVPLLLAAPPSALADFDASAVVAPPVPSDVGVVQAVAPTRCRSCAHDVSSCSVCEGPVRGLYTWCQGCGHGGHLGHMKEWFATSTLCPTGCMHVCTLTAS